MVDHELVQFLKVMLAKAEGGEVLFFVGAGTLITARNEADVLAAAFVPPAAAALDPDSRRAAYNQTLLGIAKAAEQLSGEPSPVSDPSAIPIREKSRIIQ